MCLQFVHVFHGFTVDDIVKVRQTMVDIGKPLQLNTSENDITRLLTNKGFIELVHHVITFEEKDWDLKPQNQKRVLKKELIEAFCLIEAGIAKRSKILIQRGSPKLSHSYRGPQQQDHL